MIARLERSRGNGYVASRFLHGNSEKDRGMDCQSRGENPRKSLSWQLTAVACPPR
jgi:hypothetical protein